MKLLKLRKLDNDTPIWINPDYIVRMEHHHNDGTRLKLTSIDTHSSTVGLLIRSDTVLVKEMPEEIINVLRMDKEVRNG